MVTMGGRTHTWTTAGTLPHRIPPPPFLSWLPLMRSCRAATGRHQQRRLPQSLHLYILLIPKSGSPLPTRCPPSSCQEPPHQQVRNTSCTRRGHNTALNIGFCFIHLLNNAVLLHSRPTHRYSAGKVEMSSFESHPLEMLSAEFHNLVCSAMPSRCKT